MLVIHWAKQNATSAILANGIHPSYRRRDGARKNPRGVYVYPFSRNKTLTSNWRRNLKTWDGQLGNYNGFLFRLAEEDFPLIAGYWFFNRSSPEKYMIASLRELTEQYGKFFSGEITKPGPDGVSYNWDEFELILPRQVAAWRIMKVLKDREAKRLRRATICEE